MKYKREISAPRQLLSLEFQQFDLKDPGFDGGDIFKKKPVQFCFNSRISARSDVDELVIALSSWKKTETTHTLREFYFFPKDHFESSSQPIQWVQLSIDQYFSILKIRIVRITWLLSQILCYQIIIRKALV